jgi:hypothetical protein
MRQTGHQHGWPPPRRLFQLLVGSTRRAIQALLLGRPEELGVVHGRDSARGPLVLVFVAGIAARAWLIARYPIIFGGDGVARLAEADRVMIGHWLPLLQVAIHTLSLISPSALLVQSFMAVVGALAGVGFYLLASDLVPEPLDTAMLFVASPFILVFSIVPYQEALMLAGLFFTLHWTFTGRFGFASVALGIACLTRYEAWLLCPLVGAAYVKTKGVSVGSVLKAATLFGWAPVGWFLYNRALSPGGIVGFEWSLDPQRLWRWVYLARAAAYNSPLTGILAGFGAWVFVRQHLYRDPRWQLLAVFAALFLAAILFSDSGVEPNPVRQVVGREAHLPVAGAILLAGIGLGALPRGRHLVTIASVAVGLWMANRFVARAVAEPHLALSYEVGAALRHDVHPTDTVIVLAHTISTEGYFAHIEAARGERAVEVAIRGLENLESLPADYSGVLVASGLGKERVRSYSTFLLGRFASRLPSERPVHVARATWFVLWSDFTPSNAIEACLAKVVTTAQPRETFTKDSVWVRVYAVEWADRSGAPASPHGG